jgi:Tfp pilus assembly protein PilN
MKQINLLPPEIAERRRAREITLLIGAAGLALVTLLVIVFLVQTARVAGERRRLEDVKRENVALQRRVDELQVFARSEQTLKTKEQLLSSLTQTEVRWSVILNDVSMMIPSDVWLTSFTGTVHATAGTPPPGTQVPFGNIAFGGSTFTHLDVAKWLSRLAQIPEFSFPYLTLSAKGGAAEGTTIVTFNSTVDLSNSALRRNQPGGVRNQ